MSNVTTTRASFRVSINLASYTAAAPSDGAIDPIGLAQYRQKIIVTGSTTTPTANIGDQLVINGVACTVGTASSAGIVAAVNALTDFHHVVAGTATTAALQLLNEPLYETTGITINGSAGVLASTGLTTPTVTNLSQVLPSTLALSIAKTRANRRWNALVKFLSFEASPDYVGAVAMTGTSSTTGSTDANTPATSLAFTVVYEKYSNLYTYDELNGNALITGSAALVRMVARALTWSATQVVDVFNPTANAAPAFTIGDQLISINIGALETSLTTAANNISVVEIINTK